MPFNPDGSSGNQWDEASKRWVPAVKAQAGANGWSNVATQNYGDGGEGWNTSGQPGTTGRTSSPGAWGGYTGHMLDNGEGGVSFDPTHSGRADAVEHLSGLGAAAASQQAYQNDYGSANQFAGMGQDDRGLQLDAMGMARDTAMGRNLQSQALGQQMLQQGVQAQQAGAASARGGSLAQAAAMRQQAAGQGAYMQQGNTMLHAQRAAEMAAGREQYMQQATGLRAGDAQAQGLSQQQAIQQMGNELQQRQLSQKGEMGYQEMIQDTNLGAANASLGQHEANAGLADTSMQRHQNKLDQGQQWVADGVQAAGALAAGVGGMGGGSKPPPPTTSDARGKTNITSLASAALKRRAAR